MDTEISYKRIGRHLQEARKRAGFTQAEVAEKFEISENTYGNMERGSQSPNLQRIIQACLLYGIAPGEILNDCHDGLIEKAHTTLKVETSSKKELLCLLDKCSERTLHLINAVARALYAEAEK